MCGQFTLFADLSVIIQSFYVEEVAGDCRTGSDNFPGQYVCAIVHDGKNRLVNFRWGLIPAWAKDPSIGRKMFNARAETIAEKPSFRNAFRKRRCLVVADGFYEWQKRGKGKVPLHYSLRSGEPFGFAGLYETWLTPERTALKTCTIITTEPNDLVRPVHDRMPAIIPKAKEGHWLDPKVGDVKELMPLLRPYPSEEMKVRETIFISAGGSV